MASPVLLLALAALTTRAESKPVTGLAPPDGTLRVLTPDLLEVELLQLRAPDGTTTVQPWNLAMPAAAVIIPRPSQFEVTAGGQEFAVRDVALKRRVLSAPLDHRELRVATWLYLRLDHALPGGAEVSATNPDGTLWPEASGLHARLDPLRLSPAIHVNQEGYLPGLPKKAMVGYFLGSGGEMKFAAGQGFELISVAGARVYAGELKRRPDVGYAYSPTPYQEVYEADFSAFHTPGRYRLAVPGLGASLPFAIGDGVAIDFARAYALGLYHQRCGTDNALPFTRFVHGACHVAPAAVPSPESDYAFTWRTVAQRSAEGERKPGLTAPALTGEAAQLFPFVRKGAVDVSGGHHDAGDYSKYTINSAAFVHCLVFAVDSLPGAAELDNLGLPESGDGISDLLQEAKWEVDFLARMQDDDGGFYFLVYPRNRAYENDVPPDRGDPQVVWPKNTAATAAAVAALAQASSSPRFRRAYPAAAADCLARAQRGWRFLTDAHARFGRPGSYQRLTHYGDNYRDDDELAWAACELFLATGDGRYHEKFHEWCDPASAETRRWGWWRLNESWGNAIRSYAFGARSGRVPAGALDRQLREKCEQEIESAGRDALRWSARNAYGTSFPDETKRVRGGGWYFSLDQAFDLAVASELAYPPANDPRPQFLDAYLANLNYEAGSNPVNVCYVTGLGQRRPRELVHQYAQNDRRMLPPSGLPLGNLQAGLPYLANYQGELGGLSFPEDGAGTAPYPYYDRWSDTYNTSTEFVIVNQARALAGLAWLAARTGAGRQPWRTASARITGLPAKTAVGEPVTARLVIPAGFDAKQADIVWEARDQEPGQGPDFTFKPRRHGPQWIEAEARWPDGRRLFAAAEFAADNGRPAVTVTTGKSPAAVASGTPGTFLFHRTGDLSAPLTVHFDLRGDATKWNDYRRPEGDMPVEAVIPAGKDAVELTIVPVAGGLGAHARHVMLVLAPDDSYNLVAPHAAIVTLIGVGAPPPPALPALPPLS